MQEIKTKMLTVLKTDQAKEWLFAVFLLVACALISRFFIKDRVNPEHYKTISFAFWGICILIFMPIFKFFFKK